MNQKNVKINIYQVFMLICVQVILKATFQKMIFPFYVITRFSIKYLLFYHPYKSDDRFVKSFQLHFQKAILELGTILIIWRISLY